MFDLAIIGGGPAGYVAAGRAGSKGLKVVLFEKKELGGVCLNEGCIPTKTLLYSAKVYDTATGGAKYGVTAGDVSFDYARMVDRKNKVVRKLVAGIGMQMKSSGVEVVKGEASIKSRDANGFTIVCGETLYRCANILISTGSQAAVPPIQGLAESGEIVMTNREILAVKERPASLVIIGGGVIGMEFASLFNSLGTKVAIVEMLPEILGEMDAEISAMLREIYAKKGVEFHLSCKVVRIEGNNVFFTDKDGVEHSVAGERILVSVGRKAVTAGIGLESVGVEFDRGAVRVDGQMRTNIPGIYAAGDVTGSWMLAHVASREAEVVVNNLTGHQDAMSYDAVPGVVFTNPEVASAGLTLAAAEQKGMSCTEKKLPMAFSGRFVAENEGGAGLCKVVTDNTTGRIAGVHLLGNPAGEIIWGACMAIEQGLNATQFEKVIVPHPTVSEIIKETLA